MLANFKEVFLLIVKGNVPPLNAQLGVPIVKLYRTSFVTVMFWEVFITPEYKISEVFGLINETVPPDTGSSNSIVKVIPPHSGDKNLPFSFSINVLNVVKFKNVDVSLEQYFNAFKGLLIQQTWSESQINEYIVELAREIEDV